jgi:hypothetical protein
MQGAGGVAAQVLSRAAVECLFGLDGQILMPRRNGFIEHFEMLILRANRSIMQE